jgi:hypothetical protein
MACWEPSTVYFTKTRTPPKKRISARLKSLFLDTIAHDWLHHFSRGKLRRAQMIARYAMERENDLRPPPPLPQKRHIGGGFLT